MRHLRLRKVLEAQGYTGKDKHEAVAFEHNNWKEDGESLPTIEQVRKMHSTLGTWDKLVSWVRWETEEGEIHNTIYLRNGKWVQILKPKANYKAIKKAKESRWKEQERRTEEFFDSMGV